MDAFESIVRRLRTLEARQTPADPTQNQHSELQRRVMAMGTPQQVALRCRIVLAVTAGKTELEIAAENKVNRKTVTPSGVSAVATPVSRRFGRLLRDEAVLTLDWLSPCAAAIVPKLQCVVA